ncbi:MAG: hypothetical protein IRZ15_03490 [Bryobacteraceae bacterium]|nr:hypothetical protein [Bryobacteraceae bacterium]
MYRITVAVGVLLILLGVGGYLATRTSLTALIPAGFGVLFLVLGLIARNPKSRKHAMHAAAMLGVLGILGSARGLARLPALLSGQDVPRPAAVAAQSAMAAILIVFVALCVKSFVDARRARPQP